MEGVWRDYLDIILVALLVSGGWMVYRLILRGQEFHERWEDLPEETKLYVRRRRRYPLLRFLWNLVKRDVDILLAGILMLFMTGLLFWLL